MRGRIEPALKWRGGRWVCLDTSGRELPYEVKGGGQLLALDGVPVPKQDPLADVAQAELKHFQATRTKIAASLAGLDGEHAYKIDADALAPGAYAELCAWALTCADELGCAHAVPLVIRPAKPGEQPDLRDRQRIWGKCIRGDTLGGHPVVYILIRELADMLKTCAHEACHVWQFRSSLELSEADAETHAEHFAAKMMARYSPEQAPEPEPEPGMCTYKSGLPILPNAMWPATSRPRVRLPLVVF